MKAQPTHIAEADASGFAALGLDDRLLKGLAELGYEEPTAIQQEAIPPLLEGRDLVGQAATGTGKTAAFALPLLQRLSERRGHGRPPAALILVPTRELAMQVAEAVQRYGSLLEVGVVALYGGQPFSPQLRALQRGVDVAVATPGRALDHLRRGSLSLAAAQIVVLDEADEMLDMGFADDLDAILAAAPDERQTVLFSATMPARIAAIAKRHLHDPVQLRIAAERTRAGATPRVQQRVYVVARAHKSAALRRVLDVEQPTAAIVFCRTRNEVDELGEQLTTAGRRAEVLHGGMSQEQRDRVMTKLRGETAALVIATDVAARGLDIAQLTHVINYDVPSAPESYVHRIGRVGRAGREGVAITFAEPREQRLMRNIEQLTKCRIEVAPVPTIAELRARRAQHAADALRAAVQDQVDASLHSAAEALLGEVDAPRLIAAALTLLQGTGSVEAEIPAIAEPPRRFELRERGAEREFVRAPRAGRGAADRTQAGMTRLFIGGGREMGIRPQDLVGAITGEAGIAGREIGAISILDRFSLVDVRSELADDVIEALQGSAIKGRRVQVRLDRPQEPGAGEHQAADDAERRPARGDARRRDGATRRR